MRGLRHLTPRYLVNRAIVSLYATRNPDHPWLTKEANSILSPLLRPTDMVLEWGSGRSTLWLARRVSRVTSVEHDKSWFIRVTDKLRAANIANVDYFLHELVEGEEPEESRYVRVLDSFRDDGLDVALVDGKYRDACANGVLPKICPGGILVLDNANWYLPCNSVSPHSRPRNAAPTSEGWARFLEQVKDWRLIWTSNGVWDTAIWFRPVR